MHKQKVLVIGGDGLIGKALVALLPRDEYDVERTTRREGGHGMFLDMEVASLGVVSGFFGNYDIVFNCAAMAGFAICELNPMSYRVNVDAPIAIARSLQPGQKLVHLSTDVVDYGIHTALGMQKAFAEIGLGAIGNTITIRLRRVTDVADTCNKIMAYSKLTPPCLCLP